MRSMFAVEGTGSLVDMAVAGMVVVEDQALKFGGPSIDRAC